MPLEDKPNLHFQPFVSPSHPFKLSMRWVHYCQFFLMTIITHLKLTKLRRRDIKTRYTSISSWSSSFIVLNFDKIRDILRMCSLMLLEPLYLMEGSLYRSIIISAFSVFTKCCSDCSWNLLPLVFSAITPRNISRTTLFMIIKFKVFEQSH